MDILTRSSNAVKFKDYTLHDFQTKAIKYVEQDESVIVSTHTGNGKTLIAEAAIEICKREGKKIIYTAPIKALSNQKLKQFSSDDEKDFVNGKFDNLREEYGESLVGLMTGDRVINPEAPIILMTTEILCNMLYDQPEKIENKVKYIVFDEIHNLSDPDRGTIWEECLIKKPKDCKIIGLSATVPNSQEICDWIKDLHQEKINDITYKERLTPLNYSFFHKDYGTCDHNKLLEILKSDNKTKKTVTSHLDFIDFAKDKGFLNVLGFFNSRSKCETNAQELSDFYNFLVTTEKEQVENILEKYNISYPELNEIKSWKLFQKTAQKGILFYHSGLVPIVKDACEEILNAGLGRVCYGTDAIAQGVNIPFKTVFMDTMIDPYTKTRISGATFKQRSGRAGRKGFDKEGFVFVLANIDEKDVVDLSKIDGENVNSQLKLPFNRVLKHSEKKDIDSFLNNSFASFQHSNKKIKLKKHKEKMNSRLTEEINSSKISCKTFDKPTCPVLNNQLRRKLNSLNSKISNCKDNNEKEKLSEEIRRTKQLVKDSLNIIRCTNKHAKDCICQYSKISNLQEEIKKADVELENALNENPISKFKTEYNNKMKLMRHLNFIDANDNLNYKGNLCSNIYIEELLVSELIEKGLFYNHDVDTINAYLSGIVYENNKRFDSSYNNNFEASFIDKTIEKLQKNATKFNLDLELNFNSLICPVIYDWSTGASLKTINENCSLFEGDFINICKQLVSLLSQIKKACADESYVVSKVDECTEKIKRGIVSLCF